MLEKVQDLEYQLNNKNESVENYQKFNDNNNSSSQASRLSFPFLHAIYRFVAWRDHIRRSSINDNFIRIWLDYPLNMIVMQSSSTQSIRILT